jgi:hypothetical protein
MAETVFVNTCASCGAEESLDSVLRRMIDDDATRRLIADVVSISLPLGNLVVRYLRLHKPPKQRLSMAKAAKVLAELLPDLQRDVVQRNGRTWTVTLDDWKGAFQAVFDAVERGSLAVPLAQGNGYLYGVLVNKSNQTEAEAETAREDERRRGVVKGTVQVRGQSMDIGTALDVVYGGGIPPAPAMPPGPKTDSYTVRKFKEAIAAKKAGEAAHGEGQP